MLLPALGALLMSTSAAHAQFSYSVFPGSVVVVDPNLLAPVWACVRGDGVTCTDAELASPSVYRQILVVPTGYTTSQKSQFYADAEVLRRNMSTLPGSTVYSEVHQQRLLYLAYYQEGGALGTSTAAFGGKVFTHPIRGKALTMNQEAVYALVPALQATKIPALSPAVVVTLFNTKETGITANATPPSYTGRAYGIARVTSGDIQGTYVSTHEVGHGLVSWVDEYVEAGFENMNIRQLDALTPLAIWDGSFGSLVDAVGDLLGIYDMNISEILANNGADNVALSSHPSTVGSPVPSEAYEYEGGMFFGRGTWHDAGNNIMNSNRVVRGPDDYFGYAHSPAQQRIVNTVFVTGQAGRANDRLRNAGPVSGWKGEFGGSTTVMLFDGDKNHRWHPTRYYEVQVGWWERVWETCWEWGFIPYPCYTDVWRTAQKTVYPRREWIELKTTSLYGLSSLAQQVFCGLGLGGLAGGIDLCTLTVDQMSDAFLPTLKFPLPYQSTTVPASQWFTTYWWRFRTYNGRYLSNWTNWSSFYRSL
jgi:hypothetical protein